MDRRQRIPLRTIMVPDTFKVLPPLSPELPAPPPAPKPSRVAPLTVSRRDQTAFVILQESNSRPTSRSPTPVSGRVSPFRGRGFKSPTNSRHPSRDPTPERSRSRLPVAKPTGRSSVSTSPSRNKSTSIPKPILRRNSLSPRRATQALNQINRNKSFITSKSTQNLNVTQNKPINSSPARRLSKPAASSKRVGPLNVKNTSLIISKPPIPKTNQKRIDVTLKQNVPPPKRQAANNVKSKTDDNSSTSSNIPKMRNVNSKNVSPQKLPPKAKPRTKPQQKKDNENPPTEKVIESTVLPIVNNQNTTETNNAEEEKQPSNDIDRHNNVENNTERNVLEKQNIVDEPPVKFTKATHSVESEPNKSIDSNEPPEVTSSDGLSIKSKVTITSNFVEEDIPEATITLIRTTTAPALELAQPDVIPNILSPSLEKPDAEKTETNEKQTKEEHIEIKEKIIDKGEMVDDVKTELETVTDTGLSVESVRSTSSIETVRAVAKVKANFKKHEEDVKGSIKEEPDAEVLSANNLIRTDSINNNSNRTVAWENTSPGENSVYPVEPIIEQPRKAKGCCGKFLDKITCKCCKKSGNNGNCFGGMGKYCKKLNCCKGSSCCKKQKEEKQKQKPLPRQKKSKLKDCLSRLNCCRSMKCCKKTQRPLEEDADDSEPPPGCCAVCKRRSKNCGNALFCMNLACCQKLRTCSGCIRFQCCRIGGCCGASPPDLDRRKSRHSLKRSQTITNVGLPKLDPSLVDHAAFIRSAIPVLPVPLAWICLIFNVFLPGTGTLFSGMFCLCVGKPRFSINDSHAERLKSFLVNLIVAVIQVFSIIFCLVGWGWSIWWGIIMLRIAKKNRRIQLAEKNAEQPVPVALNQNHDVERAR